MRLVDNLRLSPKYKCSDILRTSRDGLGFERKKCFLGCDEFNLGIIYHHNSIMKKINFLIWHVSIIGENGSKTSE